MPKDQFYKELLPEANDEDFITQVSSYRQKDIMFFSAISG